MSEYIQPKKHWLRRFWWLFPMAIILFFAIFIGVDYFSGQGARIVKTFKPNTDAPFYCNPPTIVDKFIYIGTSINTSLDTQKDNFFYKLDLDLGKIWEYKLPEFREVEGGAALDSQGNIYFYVSKRGGKKDPQEMELYSLTKEGEFRWKKLVSYAGEKFDSGPTTPAIGTDDMIYAGGSKLFALKSDGTEKWIFPKDSRVFTGFRSSPIIDGAGNIYIVAPEAGKPQEESAIMSVHKFAAQSEGVPLWSAEVKNNPVTDIEGYTPYPPRTITSTPAFTTNFKRIIAATGNTVNAVDTETGKLLWSFKPEGIWGHFEASPAIDNQDNIYIGTKANEKSTFYAIRANGQGLLWENNVAGDLYSSPSIGDNGIIYVGSEYNDKGDGQFHAIDMKTGKYKWNISVKWLKDFQKTAPAILDGYAYIGSMRQFVYGPLLKIKIDSQGYQLGAAWPRFHGGNANNGRLKK